jgi:hypothetical protein
VGVGKYFKNAASLILCVYLVCASWYGIEKTSQEIFPKWYTSYFSGFAPLIAGVFILKNQENQWNRGYAKGRKDALHNFRLHGEPLEYPEDSSG